MPLLRRTLVTDHQSPISGPMTIGLPGSLPATVTAPAFVMGVAGGGVHDEARSHAGRSRGEIADHLPYVLDAGPDQDSLLIEAISPACDRCGVRKLVPWSVPGGQAEQMALGIGQHDPLVTAGLELQPAPL